MDGEDQYKVKIFGKHNLLNLSGAKEVLSRLSITKQDFYEAIQSFELPSLRLNVLKEGPTYSVFRDYAHAPSKVEATVAAVKEKDSKRKLIGVFELHTYSSLNKEFLGRYANSLNPCDEAIIFFSPKAVEQKKLEPLSLDEVKNAFNHPNLELINNKESLKDRLDAVSFENTNLLLMSSANFGGLELNKLYQ